MDFLFYILILIFMSNYDKFFKFYDQVMGEREDSARDILGYIQEFTPHAKKVLELACGSGSVLTFLAEKYEVHGLDLSEWMLQIAREKIPNAKLYHQNMVDFEIDEKFDVILCVFDSINHLLDFENWKKVFIDAKNHLNPGGLFIFDMNTQEKLIRTIEESPRVKPFDENIMIMDVTDAGKEISNWNIKVFEKKDEKMYELHEENICEISFPIEDVENELKKTYSEVIVRDKFRKSPRAYLQSVYFICK